MRRGNNNNNELDDGITLDRRLGTTYSGYFAVLGGENKLTADESITTYDISILPVEASYNNMREKMILVSRKVCWMIQNSIY